MARMCLVPRFRIREGHFEAFLRRVCQQRDDCLEKEPGCHHFDVLVARDRPDEVLLYEIYQYAEAIKTHRPYPHHLSRSEKSRVGQEWVSTSNIGRSA